MSNLFRNIFSSTAKWSIPATIWLAGVVAPTYAQTLTESSLKQIEQYSEHNSLEWQTKGFGSERQRNLI